MNIAFSWQWREEAGLAAALDGYAVSRKRAVALPQ